MNSGWVVVGIMGIVALVAVVLVARTQTARGPLAESEQDGAPSPRGDDEVVGEDW